MLISGIQPFTQLDFPGRLACIVFTAGCNLRCGYCHNPEFVLPEKIAKLKNSFVKEDALFTFLEKRKGLLDGVVISGGEPTLAPDLLSVMERIKNMGFLVKLDTNGMRPEVIEQALQQNLVDYIAMDVKTSLATYATVGCLQSESIAQSIDMIKHSGVEYEFRSTLMKEIHTPEVLEEMAELLSGSSQLFLQQFRPGHTLDPSYAEYTSFSEIEMKMLAGNVFKLVENVQVRV